MWKSSFIIAIAVFVAACGRVPTGPQYSAPKDAVVQQASEVDDGRGEKEHQNTFHCEDESIGQQVSETNDSKGGKEHQSTFHCEQEPVQADTEESVVQPVSKIDDSKGGKEFQVSFQCTENAVDDSITR